MPGEPNAEMPQVSLPKLDVPAPGKPLIPRGPNLSESNLQGEKPRSDAELNNTEWEKILDLGKKSFLDLKPEELSELQGLTEKGKRILGSDFDRQLAQKKAEALQKQRKQEIASPNELTDKIAQIANASKQKMRKLIQGFEDRALERSKEDELRGDELRKELDEAKNKPANQRIQDVLNDPKMAGVKAEMDWTSFLGGKKIEGVDPDLEERVAELRKDAIQKVMKDPHGYESQLQALKAEFFRSRGIVLPSSQSKTNSV